MRYSWGDQVVSRETVTGVVDLQTGDRSLVSRLSASSATEATLPPSPPPMWMITRDGHVYLKGERVTENVPGSPEWVRLPDRELGPAVALGGGIAGDPTQALDLFVGATGAAEEVGVDAVRGIDALHYRVRLDPERMMRRAPDVDEMKSTLELFEVWGYAGPVPVDFWIDGDARFVRLRFAATDESETVTIELFDYGVETSIEPPPDAMPVNLYDLIRPASDP